MRRETAAQHLRLKRSLVNLDERDPSLISLPVPLPSIPVLSPLLTPLVGGNNQGAASPSPTPTTLSANAPASTPNGGGGGGNDGQSPGNGGGKPGNGGGNPGNGGGNPDNGGSSTSDGGTSNGNGKGNNPNNGSTGSNPSGGSSPNEGTGSTTSGTRQAVPSATPGSTVGGANGTTSGSPVLVNVGSSPSSIINNDGSSHPSGGLSSLGSDSSQTATSAIAGTPSVVGIASTPSGASSPENPSATHSASISTQAVAKGGLSSGGIAAIVIVLVLVLAGLVVFILRRRNIARRSERRNQWFEGVTAGYGSSHTLGSGPGNGSKSTAGRSGGAVGGSGSASARSSFATNFDHGLQFRVDTPITTPQFDLNAMSPAFPPMAEVRNRSGPLVNAGTESSSRYSNGSNHSATSQYLDVPGMPALPPEATAPMLGPLSPSEILPFPKPPSSHGQVDDNEKDWLTRSSPSSPIADSGRTLTPKQVGAFNSNNNTVGTSNRNRPMIPTDTADQNPFSDPTAGAATSPGPGDFAPVEVVCRPFVPTLDDELSVVPGESVCVVKVFDDGWAYVEKIGTTAKGLIPVDCMREAGAELPAFLASKRVSSYYGEGNGVVGQVIGDAL